MKKSVKQSNYNLYMQQLPVAMRFYYKCSKRELSKRGTGHFVYTLRGKAERVQEGNGDFKGLRESLSGKVLRITKVLAPVKVEV